MGNKALIKMNSKCDKSTRYYSQYTLVKNDVNWLIMKVDQKNGLLATTA